MAATSGSESLSDFDIEARLFLEAIRLKHGYDFRDYAEASLRRRIQALLRHFRVEDPLALLGRALRDPGFFREALPHMTVNTTEMFRDPPFFRVLREKVVPVLRTYPTIKIWIAGTSTGEEVYSLAILLEEEGVLDRCVIFGTDINPRVLKRAQDGIYPADAMKSYTRNYQESGGKESFSRYYAADYGFVKMNSDLVRNVVFSEHNLAADHVFAECQLVLCRNVLIYFNRELQNRALELFAGSLRFGGFLALGSKENLRFSSVAGRFEPVDEQWRIYRKRVSGTRPGGHGDDWLI